jgi:hypothetical protein
VLARTRGQQPVPGAHGGQCAEAPAAAGSVRRHVAIRSGEHAGTVDLKHTGIVPIVDLARVYALAGGHDAVNTHDRLARRQTAAKSANKARATCATRWNSSPRCASATRPARWRRPQGGQLPGLEELSNFERSQLKEAFGVVQTLQRRVGPALPGRHINARLEGPPAFVAGEGFRFTDVSVLSHGMMNAVSLINLATVRDIGVAWGVDIDPLRFRANLYMDGGDAWEEASWLDRDILIGDVRARVVMRTPRCAATNVNPVTAERDMTLPATMMERYGHRDLGVYLQIIEGGAIAPGAPVTVAL